MRYPVSRLPKSIALSLEAELVHRHYIMPTTLLVKPSALFTYYMKGQEEKIGFVIETPLSFAKGPTKELHRTGERPAPSSKVMKYAKGDYVFNYAVLWGTWNGDLITRSGVVNTDNTERLLSPNASVVKCYVGRNNKVSGEVLFRPTEMPPAISQIVLSDRERTIMFIYARLKNSSERTLTLARLNITEQEIKTLLDKQALRSTKNGYVVTVAGFAAQSENPKVDRW